MVGTARARSGQLASLPRFGVGAGRLSTPCRFRLAPFVVCR